MIKQIKICELINSNSNNNNKKVELDQCDLDPDCSYLRRNQKKQIKCCFLTKQRPNRVKNDGISSFIEYINQRENIHKANKRNQQQQQQPPNLTNTKSSSKEKGVDYLELCRTTSCTRRVMHDRVKYYGFCYECFQSLFCQPSEINTTTNNNRANATSANTISQAFNIQQVPREIEHQKEHQYVELNTFNPSNKPGKRR